MSSLWIRSKVVQAFKLKYKANYKIMVLGVLEFVSVIKRVSNLGKQRGPKTQFP